MRMPGDNETGAVRSYLLGLQEAVCASLLELDPTPSRQRDEWARPQGGGGITRVLERGALFEKAGVGFSDVLGAGLPPSATAARPDLAGLGFRAMGVSVVIHPLNPYVPTSHMNVRFFQALRGDGGTAAWWFGGGFDLTPCFPFDEDTVAWHHAAREALDPHGEGLHPRFKKWCDDYFYLPHRRESRGVGGVFFDDFNELGFERSFAMTRSVGNAFMPAYVAICRRRRDMKWGEREREHQLRMRGRYVEFNLVYDRGTLFGLQSGGRVESILMSMPPLARWDYGGK